MPAAVGVAGTVKSTPLQATSPPPTRAHMPRHHARHRRHGHARLINTSDTHRDTDHRTYQAHRGGTQTPDRHKNQEMNTTGHMRSRKSAAAVSIVRSIDAPHDPRSTASPRTPGTPQRLQRTATARTGDRGPPRDPHAMRPSEPRIVRFSCFETRGPPARAGLAAARTRHKTGRRFSFPCTP